MRPVDETDCEASMQSPSRAARTAEKKDIQVMANPGNGNDSTLTGRMRRYARVSTTVGSLAARVAGERYLGIKIERDKHAESLKEALGGLRGPLVKVAQMLATIPDALPREYADQMRQLQANAPPMGWAFVRRRMQSELGAGWQSRFADFSREAVAAASLGQVHRARTLDGEEVACKLQYPDMHSAVEADLKQLKLILGLYERYDKAVSTKQIQQELGARLVEELDYSLEARHCRLYADMLSTEPAVHVADVVADLSTNRLLTSTWLEGEPIMSLLGEPVERRNAIAVNMFRAWYVPLYFYGVIHGDPHLGNYSIRPDNTINLLDFGCVRVFPPTFVGGVIDLYHALMADDRDLAVHAYETWGFRNMTKELVEILNHWAGFLYAPVMENRERGIGHGDHGTYGRETAEKVHAELRRVGGVEVPREFVFMDRAALGLGSVFIHLKAEINWYRMFNDLIADFDADLMSRRQREMLERHDVPLPEHQKPPPAVL